jgi:hypothetical protein
MEHSIRSLGRAAVLAAMVAVAGCTATVSGEAYGPAYGPGYAPDLVAVSPGVMVIADYDEPIFYSDGLYWRYHGGGWYRSAYYRGGWVYARPPAPILRIDRPYAYRHYRPPGWQGHVARPQPYPAGGGWRGGPPPAPYARPQPQRYTAGGWRGGAAPAPVTRQLAAPPPGRAAPAPNQAHPHQQQRVAAPAPSRGGGWKGSPPSR